MNTIIRRPRYIKFLFNFKDSEFIKVITGVRRSGKTYLMKMFIAALKDNGVPAEQIIHLNFESLANAELTNAQALWNYVLQHVLKNKKMYLFFDEIQNVEHWEKAINSLRIDLDADIYLTGSNSNLLSGELVTLLSGRYVELRTYPISFKEFFDFKKGQGQQSENLFNEYLQVGGFPNAILAPNTDFRVAVQEDILNTIMYRDIALRANVKNDQAINAITEYLMSEIGNPVSANKIAKVLQATGFKTQTKSVINYMELLGDAFIFYKTRKYDIREKKWLNTLAKYYFIDPSLRNTQLNRSYKDNLGHQLENIVYIELLRRGFKVDVGSYDNKEVDFVARKGQQVEYYQVTLQLSQSSTRETDNLRFIPDGYQKTVLSLKPDDRGTVDGIKISYLVDWLLVDDY
ncbi:ATP-binding protein [Lactobacillus sp. ESL0791]|uniref:ATP-binding protein n=1 Tax=Lactobacillus sp. ESL0791 TaxID=2983234 RepID=UPI0023F772C0|nr:ATP-binding protein [Lactobacillus sp. ESL0791]MDF7639695.1 ATP-binding protein [Lactobacillus sp. ESL0791]